MLRHLALCLACAASAHAQDLPFVTDRPGSTASAAVVPLGRVQLESGATVTFTSSTEAVSGPELLVRWTPYERVELRLGPPDYLEGDRASGFTDPSLGLKAEFGPLNGWALGAIATASIPIGDDALSTGTVDPTVILTAGRDLTTWASLGGQVQTARDGSANEWAVGGSLALSLVLGERLGTFVEVASSAPDGGAGATYLQHGYTFLVARTVQVDVHGGLGLTEASPDAFVGAGLSVRR